MLRVVSAASRDPDRQRAARAMADELASGLGGAQAQGVLFFATPHHGPAYDAFEREIRAATDARHVIGCSARGIVANDGEREVGPGVVALALAGDLAVERFYLPALRGRAHETGREIGRRAAAVAATPKTVVLLADSYNLAPDELLAGVASIEPDLVVLGGGATEDGSTGETMVAGRGATASNAVAGLVLGGVGVSCAISRASVPVTPWRTVTRADCHRILEIEGRPALAVFRESLPPSFREDVEEILPGTLAGLADPATGDAPPEDYVVRRVLGVDRRRQAILVGDEVVPGSRFAVVVRDADAARRSLEGAVADLARRRPPLAGVLYLNDIERGEALYGATDVDFAYLRRGLGDAPLAGFFASVELAPIGTRNRFHQYAGVVVAFHEAGPERP